MVDEAVRAGNDVQQRWANLANGALHAVSATEIFQGLLRAQARQFEIEAERVRVERRATLAALARRRQNDLDRANREAGRDGEPEPEEGDGASFMQQHSDNPYESDASNDQDPEEVSLGQGGAHFFPANRPFNPQVNWDDKAQ
jgi:hypothetical protein